jgi:tRNA(fMet)-specific endonuclease VapC
VIEGGLPYLFDTDALSEVLRPRPAAVYVSWLGAVSREEQFTSAICVAELFEGAYLSAHAERHLRNIVERVLPAVTVLPFDVDTARSFGELAASLRRAGERLADPDLQIAATAVTHDLELVTGNLRHFARIPGLRVEPVLARARASSRK